MVAARLVFLFVLLSHVVAAVAQEPGGTLRGEVVDAHSGRPLADAAVTIEPSDPLIGATTDSLGRFSIGPVPVGLYTVRVRLLGHETLLVPEVWMRAGKETVLRIALTPAQHTLETFTVTAMAREEPEALGVRTFTVEQGLRYPAMFQDPARLVTSTPGVTAPNDQANHLVVRGNSPNANAWLLEGAEIVSPNHLGNAGTPTDLPTLSGGGVNILSAQMLGPSRLRTGVSPVMYGNALGGLMDMELRRGNAREREWTLQAGLTGLDVSTEGPIGRDGRTFHLVNYRYSTIGVLGAMGVDLGDEAITFQDISFHVGTRIGERGEARLFGMGGMSSNVFEAVEDTAQWEFDKDSRDITYTSRMGAVGGTLMLPIGTSTTLHATAVASATDQEREETLYGDDLVPWATTPRFLYERKLSAVVRLEGSAGARLRYGLGGSAMERTVVNVFGQEVAGWLLRPFAHARWDLTEHVQLSAGLGYSQFTFNNSEVLEPRAGLRWRMAKGRSIGASYGVRSQLPYHQVLNMITFSPLLPGNSALGLLRSEDLALGYDHAFNERLEARVEVYHQRLSGIPAMRSGFFFQNEEPTSSLLNVWDEPAFLPMTSAGRGTNSGVELTVDRRFADAFFWQANGSLFDSRYSWMSGEWRGTRWNGGWTANAMAGREWRKAKDDRVRTWGVSIRAHAYGGFRYTPVTIRIRDGVPLMPMPGVPFSAQHNDVFRLDARVYLKKDRAGRTSQWALDLQNATNARNEAFHYFDRRKGEMVTKYQMGLIPNFSYRIEF